MLPFIYCIFFFKFDEISVESLAAKLLGLAKYLNSLTKGKLVSRIYLNWKKASL